MVRLDLFFLPGLWQHRFHAGWLIQALRVQSRGRWTMKDSSGSASHWKRRRAEYLLQAGRLEEIRAEGLEQALGFQPGDLTDNRDEAQRLMRKPRRRIPHKQRTDAKTTR
jgi:hypothetical protein